MGTKISAKKKTANKSGTVEENICFVISPIGKEGTELHAKFKEVLEYIIKPAFDESGYKYSIIRADDINRSGSFINDILENIYSSHIVIADLTGQNPNVFYELGVRHSLRPRTILISQNLDDIPSDLREYRTIIYDTSAKGAATFKKRIKTFLQEINKEPERPDNPVLDRLGSVVENKLSQVEAERDELKNEITKILSGKAPKTPQSHTSSNARTRFRRILELKNAEKQEIFGGRFKRGDKDFTLPREQGHFSLFSLKRGKSIDGFWYVSMPISEVNIDEELSDIRVLIEKCSQGQDVSCNFIVVVENNISAKKSYLKKFEQMKEHIPEEYRKLFIFNLLDPPELENWEKELGLKV
ncbi:MAG: hypothetical protein HY885_08630 [Deltaproteobacteria bacterium]|nr:hypothetical protein [Deltaproteobacteria bacterium]